MVSGSISRRSPPPLRRISVDTPGADGRAAHELGPGPGRDGEAILAVDIDLDEITRGTFDLDVVGHYARPDVFRLTVDDRPLAPVNWETERPSA